MTNFNTQGRPNRLLFPQVFKALLHVPNALKTGFAATLLLCCLSQNSLQAQCDIGYVSGAAINLSLDNTGTTTLNSNVFVPYVTSSYPQCLPINGATLSIWEDIFATIPYPTSLPGPVFNCAQVGTVVTVYVTLDDPGPGSQSAAIPFVVTIVDNVPPVATWPSNVTASADAGACSKFVNSLTPLVSDNCPASIMTTWTRTGATPGSGSGSANGIYNVGTTSIAFTTTDGTTTLNQTVTVIITDDEDPVLSPCPANMVAGNDPGVCDASVSWTPPTATDNCPGVMVTSNYSPPHTFAVGGPYTVTYTATDASGNTDQCSFTVTVNDDEQPVLTGPFLPASIIVSPSPGCTQFVSLDGGGATDNCGLNLTNYTDGFSFSIVTNAGGPPPVATGTSSDASGIYPIGDYDITYTAHDIHGNTSSYTINLVVEDQLNPTAVCQDITVQLDANGSATVTGLDIDNGSSDNCGITTWNIAHDVAPTDGFPDGSVPPYFHPSVTFGCANITMSINTVLLEVIDANNNSDTCSAVVTVQDNLPPVALCQDITVNLVTGAPPSVDVYAQGTSPFIDNGSYDNCTSPLTDYRIRKGTSGAFNAIGVPVNFLCAEIGANTVEIQVTDEYGNSNICQATVTVRDVTPPVAFAIDITVSLNSLGQVTVCGTDIDDGSTDDCSIVSWQIGPTASGAWSTCTTYTCNNLGPNTAYLRVTDAGGNSTVAGPVTVTVQDNTPPNALCNATFTAQLNAVGSVTVFPNDIDAGSTDNCTIISRVVSPNLFNCNDIVSSPHIVLLTVTDQSSNMSICITAVTVVDPIAPVAVCNNINVALGSNGMVNVLPSQIGSFSTDNCACMLTLDMSVDTNRDDIPDSPFDPGVFTFDCSYIGDVVVEIKVTDCSNNFAMCQATINIQDNEDPVITCPMDVTIECDQSQLPAFTGTATATDNCPPPVVTFADGGHFNIVCTGTYDFQRTWTATDGEGNTSTCVQTINVLDTNGPAFTAPGDAILDCPDSYTVANHLCDTYTSTNVPVFISPSGTPTVTSTLVVPDNGRITDINVVGLQVEHTWVGDLVIELESPDGTIVTLYNNSCGSDNNIEINFDDAGAGPYPAFPCPPTDNGFYQPFGTLADFNGVQINGTWILRVFDTEDLDGGNIIGWGLNICYVNQPGNLSLTGDVSDETDNCYATPDALLTDYHAYKDFTSHAEGNAYNFSPSQWTFALVNTVDGSIDLSNVPGQISITGANNLGCCSFVDAQSNYTMNAPIPALGPGPHYIAFDWSYVSSNSDAGFDPFGYTINGVFNQLTDGAYGTFSGATMQSGRALIPVAPSQTFGFSQKSYDAFGGGATTTITNFVFIDGGMPIPVDDCPRKFCIGRVWSLEDDCGNAAANQLQIIQTQDVTPPDVAFPNTVTILAQGGICTPLVDLDLSQEITDGCSAFADLIISNDAQMNYGIGNGTFSASGFYAPGTYTITFEVTDECGNLTTHIIGLTVIDAQNPFAVCHPAITVQLDNNGQAQITPPNVDNGSSDNCGIVNMSLSQDVFSVADIGQVPVTLLVEDAQGNTNSCTSIVTVLGGVIFDAGDASGGPGDMVLVPVTVDMFTDITSFSFDMTITDGSVATVVGVQDVNPALASGFLALVNSATNVSVSWFDNLVPIGQSFANGTTIFNLKVMLTGVPGSSTPVLIDNELVSQLIGGGPSSALVPALGLAGNISVLNTGASYTIAGTLHRESLCGSDPIHLVTVDLTGSVSGNIPSAPGAFSFTVPENSNATITPTKNINWVNGVTVNDALLVHQHAAGFTPLNSPYKIIAADANKDNQVTVFDASLIHQLSIGFIPNIPGNTSWRFVPAIPALPGNPFPVGNEFLSYLNVMANIPDADFIGMKIGDVNCTASPTTGFANGVDGRAEKLNFHIADQPIVAGQDVFVTLRSKDFTNMSAYQMTLTFDQKVLQFAGVIPGELVNLSQANFNALRAGEGLLATNWYNLAPVELPDGYELFTLKFKALKDASSLSGLLAATEDYIVIEAVTGDGNLMGVDLTFESTTAAGEQLHSIFALYQNQPNPFSHKTAIGFNLPESTSATLSILDPAGRVLKLIEGDFTAGYHQVLIDRNDLPAKGILFYRLETSTHQAVRKMVLMD